MNTNTPAIEIPRDSSATDPVKLRSIDLAALNSSALMQLSWPELQDLEFEVLAAIHNKEHPCGARDARTGKPVPVAALGVSGSRMGFPLDLKYRGFGKKQDHGVGVLHAVARYSCLALALEQERCGFLAEKESYWPMFFARSSTWIRFLNETAMALKLRRIDIPLKAGKKPINRQRLLFLEINRHLAEIEHYRADPDGFLSTEDYVMPERSLAARRNKDDFGPPLPLRSWWKKWMPMARKLDDLLAKTKGNAEKWWKVIEQKILEEYQGMPYKAPKNIYLRDRVQQLGSIGLSSVQAYRKRTNETKTASGRPRGSHAKISAREKRKMETDRHGRPGDGYLPDDDMRVATREILRALREHFLQTRKKMTRRTPRRVAL